MKSKLLTLILMISSTIHAQTAKNTPINTKLLPQLLKANPELFSAVLNHPTQNEVQILYTQIDRDKNNIPHFRSYSYRLDPAWYFYPASTVKLPAAIFALEKINQLAEKNKGNAALRLNKASAMQIDSAFAGQTKVSTDPSNLKGGYPSIEHYIKKILLVSDNDAFNRLYEFIGRAEINQKLKDNGLNDSRIISRLAVGDTGESAKHTNPVSFSNNETSIKLTAQYDAKEYPLNLKNLVRGNAYLDANNKLVNEPFNFASKNAFSIADQQAVLKKLLFPEVFPQKEQFKLSAEDYAFLYKYLSMYPTESDNPVYDPKENWTTYCKFLFYGADKNELPDLHIRIFNKIGDSYGYTIDNAYLVDFKTGVEFMLTAVIQSNEDGIYNDDQYGYATVCLPFMKNLGRVIYDLELKRKKKYLPDLDKFRFTY
ncbi:MAG: serine hydrolase [Daejeonella sp.]